MKIPADYHSAFSEEKKGLKSIDFFEMGGSIALYHNIINGVHGKFYECDAIYSEPSWRNGYNKFAKRANVESSNYNQYLKAIHDCINILKKPTFIVGGKHQLKILNPQNYSCIMLNGFEAILMSWNIDKKLFRKNTDAVDYISGEYEKILDFSCGYGKLLFKFEKFIASDINKKCVYYVANKYLGLD